MALGVRAFVIPEAGQIPNANAGQPYFGHLVITQVDPTSNALIFEVAEGFFTSTPSPDVTGLGMVKRSNAGDGTGYVRDYVSPSLFGEVKKFLQTARELNPTLRLQATAEWNTSIRSRPFMKVLTDAGLLIDNAETRARYIAYDRSLRPAGANQVGSQSYVTDEKILQDSPFGANEFDETDKTIYGQNSSFMQWLISEHLPQSAVAGQDWQILLRQATEAGKAQGVEIRNRSWTGIRASEDSPIYQDPYSVSGRKLAGAGEDPGMQVALTETDEAGVRSVLAAPPLQKQIAVDTPLSITTQQMKVNLTNAGLSKELINDISDLDIHQLYSEVIQHRLNQQGYTVRASLSETQNVVLGEESLVLSITGNIPITRHDSFIANVLDVAQLHIDNIESVLVVQRLDTLTARQLASEALPAEGNRYVMFGRVDDGTATLEPAAEIAQSLQSDVEAPGAEVGKLLSAIP